MEKSFLDIINPVGTFQEGKRQTSVPIPLQPRLCMKRFPEYGQRRSIKDMFSNMSSNSNNSKRSSPSSSSSPRDSRNTSKDPEPPSKRAKYISPVSKSRNGHSRDQKSLRGYFHPATPKHAGMGSNTLKLSEPDIGNPIEAKEASSTTAEALNLMANTTVCEDEKVGSEISRENWLKIFSKPTPPLCDGHSEQCIQLKTKKPGPNFGRAFWTCRRYVELQYPLHACG